MLFVFAYVISVSVYNTIACVLLLLMRRHSAVGIVFALHEALGWTLII